MSQFIVIEGDHKDPNDFATLDNKVTKAIYGPFDSKEEADNTAKHLIQKNIDNFYHRAWVKLK
ncbi:hypothetical protein OAA42_01460 [Pelagibacteraceae bacterium]|nr:hypothetical protein [Pelagibacteraceae bacterium]MDC0412918.1 hypothetical protein [Pelagibacteraceae bacterium]